MRRRSLLVKQFFGVALIAAILAVAFCSWLVSRKSTVGFFTFSGFATDDLRFFYFDGTNVWVCSENLPPDYSGKCQLDVKTKEFKWTLKNGLVVTVYPDPIQIKGYDSNGKRMFHEWRRFDIGPCKAVVAKWKPEMNKIISENSER